MAAKKLREGARRAQWPGNGSEQVKTDRSSWRFTLAAITLGMGTDGQERHPDNTVDGPESCRLLPVTFSGGWAGWPLEPAQALEGDVSSFQDTFINLPLILQAGEIPRSPIGFPLHRMEVGRIYTENNEIFKKRRGKKKKKPQQLVFLTVF